MMTVTSLLLPWELPCPLCKRKTLTCGMQVKADVETLVPDRPYAFDVEIVTLRRAPAIWCTATGCPFVQWGQIVNGFAVFGRGAR